MITRRSVRSAPVAELRPGQQAPAFRLRDQRGLEVASESLRGTRVVVYFFPKADTPG
jgi:thioredoxin-dependent peroxiredoxin